jgi:hypothetical protein
MSGINGLKRPAGSRKNASGETAVFLEIGDRVKRDKVNADITWLRDRGESPGTFEACQSVADELDNAPC